MIRRPVIAVGLLILGVASISRANGDDRRSAALSADQARVITAASQILFRVERDRRDEAERNGLDDIQLDVKKLARRLEEFQRAEQQLAESREVAEPTRVAESETRLAQESAALDAQLMRSSSLRERISEDAPSLQDPRDRSAARTAGNRLASIEADIRAALALEGSERATALARIHSQLEVREPDPRFPHPSVNRTDGFTSLPLLPFPANASGNTATSGATTP